MKEYVNLFYSIIDKIEIWESLDVKKRSIIIENFLNLSNDKGFYAEYFENYRKFLTENTLNNFTKDILNLKF